MENEEIIKEEVIPEVQIVKESIFYDHAREELENLFKYEFPQLGKEETYRLIGFIYQTTKYQEENLVVKPTIFITDSINSISRIIPKTKKIILFTDTNSDLLRKRMKSIMCFAANGWNIYINIEKEKVEYGIIKKFASITEKSLLRDILDNQSLKEKINFIRTTSIGDSGLVIDGIKSSHLNISLNFIGIKSERTYEGEIEAFVDCAISNLKTSSLKRFKDSKIIFLNVFEKIFRLSHGTICMIVDENSHIEQLFKDAVWLPDPINLYKAFFSKKEENEFILSSYTDILKTMIDYDGITIIDNSGKILGYNLFVNSSNSDEDSVIGGARLRAANTLLNMNNKGIIGVYFQSQNGYNFFKFGKAYTPKKRRRKGDQTIAVLEENKKEGNENG